ncbi:MAG TPA: 2-C-methyl-D-erythritol 4-phosphate cytidylyltransferase [Coriobacteriia bacterium]
MRAAVIVAGGGGERFGRPGGKQLAEVAGAPVAGHALRAFEAASSIDVVVLVCHPDRVEEYRDAVVASAGARKVIAVVGGGATRRQSVAAGLRALPAEADLVAVHDGARPLVEPGVIDAAVAALEARADVDGVVVGHRAFDTVKTVAPSLLVTGTPDREGLWIAQTPQVFRTRALLRAHAQADEAGFEGTDDASLVERAGGVVLMHEGPRWNIKITVPEDLAVAGALLRDRAGRSGDV